MRENILEPLGLWSSQIYKTIFGSGLICRDDLLVSTRQLLKHQILTSCFGCILLGAWSKMQSTTY
jgi:hypothetical protein